MKKLNESKLNFSALAKVMEKIDDNGKSGRCGNWAMGLGGYDTGYEIYYKGTPVARVNYEFKEYELYHDGFVTRETLPEFLKAIDAVGFKNVHEKDTGPYKEGDWVKWHDQEWYIDDGWFDDEDKCYFYTLKQSNGHKMDAVREEELTPADDEDEEMMQESGESNLEMFLAEKEREFEPSGVNPSWDLSEDKVWAVQEYLSQMGEFTDEDREFLKQTDPELLSLEEEDIVNESMSLKDITKRYSAERRTALDGKSWWVAFDNETGKYIPGSKKYKTKGECETGIIIDMKHGRLDATPDELDTIDVAFGGMKTESARKQKMKFKRIVKEGSELLKFKRAIEAAKKRVIRDVKHHGVSEKQGDIELRELRDRLFDIEHDWKNKTCSRDEELLMGKMLDDFEDWVSTYNGRMKESTNRLSKFYAEFNKMNESTRKNEMKFKKIVKEADEDVDMGEPKIYVGTYAKYNNGSIDGKWITLSDYNTYEEFLEACYKLHEDEDDPEFMVQDYENFPEKWYHEGGLPTEEEFDKINEYYLMDDSEKDAYAAYVSHTDNDSIDDFHEAYQGQFDSAEDFAYHIVDSMGWDSLGQENLDTYFDYDSFGRDLMYDFHIGDPDNTDSEGEPEDPDHYYDNDGYDLGEYESDRQVAEDYIDSLGGVDQLGPDTARNYFDYDSFGRDLFINDYFEEDGYVFSRN